jgi:hypothetical protein
MIAALHKIMSGIYRATLRLPRSSSVQHSDLMPDTIDS